MQNDLIRIQFWNGQLDKKGNLVKTQHNPCLWANFGTEEKPWRTSYKQALQALQKYFTQQRSGTQLLHDIRYVAYGLGKRDYNDKQVVWWGNMTEKHKPKLVVENRGQKYTIDFFFEGQEWSTTIKKGEADFHWPL